MTEAQWQLVTEIFDSALRCAPEERRHFVHKACDDDKTVISEVESLLSSLEGAESFLETPAVAAVARGIEGETKHLERGQILGQYEIVEQIGEGGMGEVYLAKDKKLDRHVAVKVLNEKLSRDNANLQRFIREAKAASALNHPNILVIHEIAESRKAHFIVSEHIEGNTLREILRDKLLEVPGVIDVGVQIARALVAAHEASLVHRDIKPENIMIRPDGVVKVLDFGLAKLVEQKNKSVLGLEDPTLQQNLTAIGMILGTVAYMSPEQTRGDRIDARTDIFSFGTLLYEMLTGEQPFTGETASHTIIAILEQEPAPVSLFVNSYPPELERIIKKCLEKKVDNRYGLAKALLEDLEELKGELTFQSKLERNSGLNKNTKARTQLIQPPIKADTEKRNSIAVLPFTNMSAESENEYFCDGLAEELLNALAKIEDLKVAARTSAFSFKNKNVEISKIGETLNVSTLLEGSVRRSGNRLRISVQLVNAAEGYHLWSESYDREMQDIFDVQDEITLAVVDALKVKLLGGEKAAILKRYTENPEAYDLYLNGLYHCYKWTDEGLRKSIEYFEKALEKDPQFAPAYAKIADYYHFSSHIGLFSPQNILPKWKAAALRALEIDNGLSDAHLAMAHIYFYYERDWARADSEFQQAVKLNPNSTYAHKHYGLFLASRERFEEAVTEGRRALELDPLSIAVNMVVGFIYLFANRLDDVQRVVRRMTELESDSPQAYWLRGSLLMADGHYAEAVEAFQKALGLGDNQMALSKLGCAYGLSGRRDESLGVLDQLFEMRERHYADPFNIARVYAGLGDIDNSFKWMERAIEECSADVVFLKRYVEAGAGIYLGKTFANDPRYQAILHGAGLPIHKIGSRRATNGIGEVHEAIPSPTTTNAKECWTNSLETSESISRTDRPKPKPERTTSTDIRRATAGESDLPTTETRNTFSQKFKRSKPLVVVGAIALLAGAISLAYYFFYAGIPASSDGGKRSIAVLPFKPLNADSRDEALEMGMAETLITRLSSLKQVVVRPMTAVRKYTDPQQDSIKAGQDLQTEVVLDGSIQKAGERVRITVRLINTHDGTPLWSEQFDDNFADIFKMQDAIAERITNALALRLSSQEKVQLAKRYTESPEAYQLYLQGEYLWLNRRKDNLAEQSLTYYQRALEKDPNFALAYIGTADYYIRESNRSISGREAESKARSNIMRALEIDDTLAEAHNALAELKYQYEYDWSGAERDFKKAVELNPNSAAIHLAYGWFLMSAARFDEAVPEMEKAREFDPSSLTAKVARGRLLYFSRQYDQALQHFQNIIAVEPNSPSAYFSIAQIYLQKRMFEEFFEAWIKYQGLIGMPPEDLEKLQKAFNVSGFTGFARKVLELSDAKAKTGTRVSASTRALINTHLGRKDEAFAWLEKAFDEREPFMVQLKINPELDSLRDDPRFQDLQRRVGFAQ